MQPMPAVTPMAKREGTYVLLQAALPGSPVHNIGVLLLDPRTDRLFFKLRGSFDDIAGPEDVEVLAALEEDVRQMAASMGAGEYMRWLADTVSNVIRVTDPVAVQVYSFTRELERLFGLHVEPVKVEPYRTHLPLYPMRAAAGQFSEEQPLEEEPEDWVPAPRASRDEFVCLVAGNSMEPVIPANTLNVFRRERGGSRQGKIVLVELRNVAGEGRFTGKRYTSTKLEEADGTWRHDAIKLLPANHEHQPIDLLPGDLTVIGEWVCTLE